MICVVNEWSHNLEGEASGDFNNLLNCLKKMRIMLALEDHVEFKQAVKKGDNAINPSLKRLLKSKQSIVFSI